MRSVYLPIIAADLLDRASEGEAYRCDGNRKEACSMIAFDARMVEGQSGELPDTDRWYGIFSGGAPLKNHLEG